MEPCHNWALLKSSICPLNNKHKQWRYDDGAGLRDPAGSSYQHGYLCSTYHMTTMTLTPISDSLHGETVQRDKLDLSWFGEEN